MYFTVNRSEINQLLGETELTEEEKKKQAEKSVEMYISMYSNKTVNELQEIIDNPDSYTASAILAAKRLSETNNMP